MLGFTSNISPAKKHPWEGYAKHAGKKKHVTDDQEKSKPNLKFHMGINVYPPGN